MPEQKPPAAAPRQEFLDALWAKARKSNAGVLALARKHRGELRLRAETVRPMEIPAKGTAPMLVHAADDAERGTVLIVEFAERCAVDDAVDAVAALNLEADCEVNHYAARLEWSLLFTDGSEDAAEEAVRGLARVLRGAEAIRAEREAREAARAEAAGAAAPG